MANRGIWIIVFALVATNCLTVGLWFQSKEEKVAEPAAVATATTVTEEVVATIGDKNITHQEWLSQLEKLYGKDTLKELINREVIYQLAEKYNIEVSEELLEQEVTMIKAMYNSIDHEQLANEEEFEKQIHYNLLLEEMLTRDVTIPEEQIQEFYEQNKSLYNIPSTYHLSHILVNTKEEADAVLKELENGSNFSVLAMEKSVDEFSSTQGGDLGFVTLDSGYLPSGYEETLLSMEPTEWKGPVEAEGKYAILYLHEKVPGKEYTYDDVKEHIRRQLALGQIEGKVTAEQFWNEVDVDWFYGQSN